MPFPTQEGNDLDMGKYIRFYPDAWIDELKKLDNATARYVAVYLKTNRYAGMIGAYYLPYVTIAHETSLDIKRVEKAMEEITKKGIACYDPKTEEVYVQSYALHNIGENLKQADNRFRAIEQTYNEIKAAWLAEKFWNDYGNAYGLEKRPDFSMTQPLLQPSLASGRTPTSPLHTPVSVKQEIAELLKRYTPEQQEALMLAWEMIALTRSRGKVADTILLVELRRWGRIDIRRVMFAINRYVDRECYKENKGEKYLYGIMRHTQDFEIDKFESGERGPQPHKPRLVSSITEHNIAVLKQLREEEGYGMPMDTQ